MASKVVDNNLNELLSNLRKDPESYFPDFETQYENFVSLESSYLSASSEFAPKLEELLMFISQIIQCFPSYSTHFADSVSSALLSRSFGMNPRMRMAYFKAFMRLRTKDLVSVQQSIDVAFRLHRCHDKQLRSLLRGFVLGDLKRTNQKQKSLKVKSTLQTFLAKTVKDGNTAVAKEAVILLVELFRKNIWKDEKTANIIAEACLAKSKKVYAKAVRFFLGHAEKSTENKDSSDSDDNGDVNRKIKQLKLGHRVGAKTKKRSKRLERSVENLKRKSERKKQDRGPLGINVPAMHMIYDPQTLTERLLHKLERCNDRLEIRLLLLELISHLIGVHQLLLLNFYPSLQKFLRPQQREITRLMLFAAEASHDQVPPDAILPMVRTITDNFVTDRASAEAITVGLNTIREICSRCPYAVDEDLLADLVQYRSYRNKNVVTAARSLIRLYRQINPALLPKKELGRPTVSVKEALTEPFDATTSAAILEGPSRVFGQKPVATGIPGAEVLVEPIADGTRKRKREQLERPVKRAKTKAGQDALEGNASEDDGAHEEEDLGVADLDEDDADGDVGSSDSTGGDSEEEGTDNSDEEDEDEENEEVEEEEETTPISEPNQSRSARAKPSVSVEDIISTRILTDEEFEAIRKRQAEKKVAFAVTGGRKKKRSQMEELVLEEDELGGADSDNDADEAAADLSKAQGLVSMRDITKLVKRAKATRADRIESIVEGRIGRKKYGFQVNRMNPHASTTNREKRKNKTFQMIKHKVRRKAKRSFREKQTALRDHLQKLAKQMRK
uniref:Protein SDA1 n=1 Tax=Schistocephalus solidus TaxID=70667 RepID=A0A0X3PK40_SCHSO